MSHSKNDAAPRQTPGEAEAPPKNEQQPSVKRAVQHSDKTEPAQSAAEKQDQKRSPGS
jgi:hypothetical protein